MSSLEHWICDRCEKLCRYTLPYCEFCNWFNPKIPFWICHKCNKYNSCKVTRCTHCQKSIEPESDSSSSDDADTDNNAEPWTCGCKTDNSASSLRCVNCGQPRMSYWACRSCSEPNEDRESRKCDSCGSLRGDAPWVDLTFSFDLLPADDA
jgi:hypothetical protein